ncbi:putative signal peptide protein [Puccinia sorghi]|uniref:Putative signal peptide protein n=1 Tax=Puccinia sorghi TaxID=27349 RepID=A0A0L6VUC7_9BASI|nr:putative signal peptide protein [Puccinia sorghi]
MRKQSTHHLTTQLIMCMHCKVCGFVWSKADHGLKPILYKKYLLAVIPTQASSTSFQCSLPTTSITSRPRASHLHQLLYPLSYSPNPTTLPMDANMIAKLQANLAQQDQMIHQLLQRVEAMELRANPT